MLISVFLSIILPSYLQVCYTQKFISKLYFMKRRLKDARRLMDHQRTLQLKTDSLSGQVVFSHRIFSKLSQYGVSEEIGTGVATNLFNVLTYIV